MCLGILNGSEAEVGENNIIGGNLSNFTQTQLKFDQRSSSLIFFLFDNIIIPFFFFCFLGAIEIFMQDKMVIYDNEKQRIGWKPEDCNTLLSLNHFI